MTEQSTTAHTQEKPSGAQQVLTVRGLAIGAVGGAEILHNVDFTLHRGEILGLVGESGSGKTTAGMACLNHFRTGLEYLGGELVLYPRDGGKVDIHQLADEELRKFRGYRVAYIPQDPALSLNPAIRVGEQIREVLDIHGYGKSPAEREARVTEVLQEVDLPGDEEYQRRWPHQLSGGQQQRIGIAMAFAMYPEVLILDEPTTGLDVSTQAHVLDTIRSMTVKQNVAGLYITHDLAVVADLADRVAVMLRGDLVEHGTVSEVLHNPQHPYTQRLLRAVPDLAGKKRIGAGAAMSATGEVDAADEAAETTQAEPSAESDTLKSDGEAAQPNAGTSGTETAGANSTGTESTGTKPSGAETSGTKATAETAAAARAAAASTGDAQPDYILQVNDLHLAYGKAQILDGIDIRLEPGECIMLLGESGSGKTTLSRCVAGLNDDYTGRVNLAGRELAKSTRKRTLTDRQEIQYVFQSPFSSLNPRRTIGESLMVPLNMSKQTPKHERKSVVMEALDAVRLGRSFFDRRPGDLSGGERQRAAIARALVNAPKVLVCDEVTSALDVSVQASIVQLLRQLRAERGLAMLFVTHNITLARHVADNIAVLNKGHIVDRGTVDDVLEHPQHDYTQHLLADVSTL